MRLAIALIVILLGTPAKAEIISATSDHYHLKQKGVSSLSPAELWARLIEPKNWWHPDHTYSGDAAKLSFTPIAGGAWREDWEGGSIVHGTVLMAQPNKALRLEAPFGPLQQMAVNVVWTITITPNEATGGSTVTFDETANGTAASKLNALAPAVDRVKTDAMERLLATD